MATEKRLIDANTALLNTYNEVYWTESEAAAVRSFLVQQKTVDAVEVVCCKDCARRKKGYCTIRKDSWGATLLVGDHDFCSDGERRTDG